MLHELIRNRAQAGPTGLEPTPPADNLIMDGGGTAPLAEMIARTKRGLLLTCLWYIRDVDPGAAAAHRPDPRRGLPDRGR